MTLLEKAFSRLLGRSLIRADLARIAGENERLADNLAHHAEVCESPGLRARIDEIAYLERADARTLRELALDHRVWPLPPQTPATQGANHWERLSADLADQLEIVRGLNALIAECERKEPELAARHRQLLEGKERTSGVLRDLALKCDPQALD
jgi:hypothetical protein